MADKCPNDCKYKQDYSCFMHDYKQPYCGEYVPTAKDIGSLVTYNNLGELIEIKKTRKSWKIMKHWKRS